MADTPTEAADIGYEALCEIVLLTLKAGYSIPSDVACGIIAGKAKHAISEMRLKMNKIKQTEIRTAAADREERNTEDGLREIHERRRACDEAE